MHSGSQSILPSAGRSEGRTWRGRPFKAILRANLAPCLQVKWNRGIPEGKFFNKINNLGILVEIITKFAFWIKANLNLVPGHFITQSRIYEQNANLAQYIRIKLSRQAKHVACHFPYGDVKYPTGLVGIKFNY